MPLTVTPRATNVGTFATTITISDNSTGQQKKIPVTVTVKDQADISVSQDSMSFVNHDEYQSTTQILIIDNDGSRPLNWTISTDTNAPWLWISTPTGAMNGTMASGDSAVVSVTCNSSNLSPGTYTVTLTIRDSNPAVPPRHVAVKLVVQ
ncbi:MAG: hypothetical protein J2P36_05415 [Ktedonobacteraceae bacterium]|nr:hypothetical protein [Ktedonobacteraceae bacterium]